MLQKILFSLLLFGSTAYAQTGIHTPSDWVQNALYKKNGTKCLTISTVETILWDVTAKTPIWIKKNSRFWCSI